MSLKYCGQHCYQPVSHPFFLASKAPFWIRAKVCSIKKEKKNQCPRLTCNIILVTKPKQMGGIESERPSWSPSPYLPQGETRSCYHRMKSIRPARRNSLWTSGLCFMRKKSIPYLFAPPFGEFLFHGAEGNNG